MKMLKIGRLYRFTNHYAFVFYDRVAAINYTETPAWQPCLYWPGRTTYNVARTMPPQTIFMIIAEDKYDTNLYQILFEGDKIGWLNYKASAQIDTSLNP